MLLCRHHLAASVQGVANVCCEGRVVSVLEGGYGTQVHERKHNTWSFNRCRSLPNLLPCLLSAC